MLKYKILPIKYFFILLLMLLQFSFGLYQIQKEAYVDEALWIYNRIPKFWQNIGERDWNGTRRSDKPGVTVMYVTGAELINKDNLIGCKNGCLDKPKLEKMLWGFRTSILFCTTLFIPFLFLFLKKLFDSKTAFFSTTFIALSPILLGMSRIVNPDALLWIFSTGAILTYLIYLKNKNNTENKYLYFSGIFMGLALMTKYVSNILFIFILILPFLDYIFSKEKWNSESTNKYFKRQLFSYLKFIAISVTTFSLLYPAVWVKSSRILKATLLSQAFESVWPFFIGILLFLILDTFVFKNYILKLPLNLLHKYKNLLKKVFSILFLLFVFIVILNMLKQIPLFDFGDILASPKSSHSKTTPFFFYLTNFYPILFGIAPIAFGAIIWTFLKTIFTKKNKLESQQNIFFYFAFFILLYYLASLFSKVAGTVRYQVILYPLILIMAGISIAELVKNIKIFRKPLYRYFTYFIFLVLLIFPLYQIKPFYMSYVSDLLPQKYFLDHKDMGSGSYRAAQYLNSLPNAELLNVWSDKKGVCTFFVGNCYSRFKLSKFKEYNFDYFVVSSGRKNLTCKRINTSLRHKHLDIPRIDKLYLQQNYDYIVKLGNRPVSSVKIFSAKNVQ